MAGELFRVILHFRSNFAGEPDKTVIERHIADYLGTMQALGPVEHVEVVAMDEVSQVQIDVATVQDRTTIPVPAPPPPSSETPAIIIEEPDTGQRKKIPGTGE